MNGIPTGEVKRTVQASEATYSPPANPTSDPEATSWGVGGLAITFDAKALTGSG